MTPAVGDRVTINQKCPVDRLKGREGTVAEIRPMDLGAMVQLDGERCTRFFRFISLQRKETPMNIKATVIETVKNLFKPADTSRDSLVKELLVALSAATAADSRKKVAKAAVVKAGIVLDEYRPGEAEVYRSDKFVVNAKTKEPTQRLDQAVLKDALRRAGLSQAKINAAFVEATVDNKAATTFEVIEL